MKVNMRRMELLEDYIARLEGGASYDEVRRDAEIHGDEGLLALLDVVAHLHTDAGGLDPEPAFINATEVRILNRLKRDPAQIPRTVRRPSLLRQRRWVRVSLAFCLALVLVFGAVGVVDASAASLPGDGLYPLKRALEQVQLGLTIRASADAERLQAQIQERLAEMEQLAGLGRYEDFGVAVDGYLRGMDEWQAVQQAQGEDAGDEAGGLDAAANAAANVAVLQRIMEQVPEQAQAALQRALARAEEHAAQQPAQGAPHEPGPDQEERQAQHEQERLNRQAEQIAAKYEVTVEDVLAVYHDLCSENWGCVRTHYRNAGGEE